MNWLKYSLVGALLVFTTNSSIRAQVIVDMSKFKCSQLLGGSQDAIEAAIWTSGYFNGLRKNTMIDLDVMKHNAEVVVAACKDDPNKTVMQTVNALLSARKKK